MTTGVIPLLQELIRNRCVNDGTPESGHEHRSVATLQEFFGMEGDVFEPSPGRQTLIYRVVGSDPTAPDLALVPHTDVVPVDASGWTVDPFAAEIVDGFVYGRGAVDMLNVTAAMAVAARPYVRGELAPRGDLVFVAAADEEAGGFLGAGALVEERWDLVHAAYCLTEVAYPALEYSAMPTVPVAVGEKGGYWTRLHTHGTPGHGSAPYRTDNALEKLVSALGGIFETPMPVDIAPEWARFVDHLDLDPETKRALTDPDEVDDALDNLAVTDPLFARYAHALTHLTISPNMLTAGMKSNVIPDAATASVDIRPLPGMDGAFVESHLRKAMASDEVEIEPVLDLHATISPTGNPLWEAIAASVEELEGHRNLVPTLMTVGTDGRFWRKRGAIGYGVGLFDDRMTFSQMLSLFHGHDERVSVASVERTTTLYQRVFHHFLGP
ncbi:MAG: M20/M25/M40 family metallo-hydrolase [Actinobacteria bacterium]|nr:M20/M25/M40 family metallo-hydrolase [Actinomycetota bacterium]